MRLSCGPQRWIVVGLCLIVAAVLSLPATASAQSREGLGRTPAVRAKTAKTPAKRSVVSQSASQSDGARLAQLLGLGQFLPPLGGIVPSVDAALTVGFPSRSPSTELGTVAAPALSGPALAATGSDSADVRLGSATTAATLTSSGVAPVAPTVTSSPAARASVPAALAAPVAVAPAAVSASSGSALSRPAKDDSEVPKLGGSLHSSWTRPPKASPYR
jgi:hypothetical protein